MRRKLYYYHTRNCKHAFSMYQCDEGILEGDKNTTTSGKYRIRERMNRTWRHCNNIVTIIFIRSCSQKTLLL